MALKPIQTKYNGCLFRSRLEARWAVFFDELDIPWEYEKEGYELSDMGRYLPDFWLPQHQCFFEVKGEKPTQTEFLKALNLSSDSQKIVAIASGTMGLELEGHGFWSPIKKDFKIFLFAGKAWDIWDTSPHDFSSWDFDISSLAEDGWLAKIHPECKQLNHMTLEGRKKIVDMDRQYYLSKYGQEHPKYMFGRHSKGQWKYDVVKGIYFVDRPENGGGQNISQAMEAASSARF